jgi:hypothetical protein
MEAKCIYSENNIPEHELARENQIYQLFNLSKFDTYQQNELYNYCSNSVDFMDIADYLCTDIQNLKENQFLGLLIPNFMKGVKKLESLDQQDVKYIRDKLVRQLIEHKVITPMQDNVTRLIIPEK